MTLQLTERRTRLYPLIHRRVAEEDRALSNLIQAWRFFPVKGLSVKDFYGKPIRYSGITFSGSPQEVFSEFFEPFMEDSATQCLEWTINYCRERSLPPEEYVNETRALLGLFVEKTYRAIAWTDQLLRGNGCPESVPPIDVSEKIRKMNSRIDDLVLALMHQGTPQVEVHSPDPSVLELKSNPYKGLEAIRKHPVKSLVILLAVILSIVAKSYFSSIGDQLARLRRPAEGVQNKQIASIEFKNEYPFVKREVIGDKSRNGYFLKVKLHNASYDTTLRVINWKLIDLRRLEDGVFKPWGNIDSASLVWDSLQTYIPPGDDVFCSFARVFPLELQKELDGDLSGDISIPQLRFTVARWLKVMTSHLEPGTYHFRLVASFDKAPPAEAELELEWLGNHRENAESMIREINIRKLM